MPGRVSVGKPIAEEPIPLESSRLKKPETSIKPSGNRKMFKIKATLAIMPLNR